MDYNLEPVTATQERLGQYQSLFLKCFGSQDRFSPAALDWLYRQNPDGGVVGFDAFAGDQLAAHYACVPAMARLFGKDVAVLLSLNTATHPEHQGKGLFTRLANATYERARAEGFASVYGVANANSTPGFIRKLRFQLVSPLLATVGLGPWRINRPRAESEAEFQRLWSDAALDWRCANPGNPVHRVRPPGGGTTCAAAGPSRFVGVRAELASPTGSRTMSERHAGVLGLHLGLIPKGCGSTIGHVNIPDVLRPSPLNLIHLDLRDDQRKLSPDRILFTFLDFDAY